VEAAGGKFYQYAFTRAELLTALERHGFTPREVHPYDPARILRKLRPRGRRATEGVAAGARRGGPLARVVRRALYTDPALRMLGHMLLVVAHRG